MLFDIFDDDWLNNFNKRPADAKLVRKEEIEIDNGKMIVEYWEGNNYKSTNTKYVYNTINEVNVEEQLQIELNAAVERQDFELAAYLRDQIKENKE